MLSCISYSFGLLFRQISLYLEYRNRSPFFSKLFCFLCIPFYYFFGFAGLFLFGFGEELDSSRLYSISVSNAHKVRLLAKLEYSGTYLEKIRFAAEEGDELANAELPILERRIDEVTNQISNLLRTFPDSRLAERFARDFDSHRNLPDGYSYEAILDLHFLYREKDNYLANGLTTEDCENYLYFPSLRYDFEFFLQKEYSSLGINY